MCRALRVESQVAKVPFVITDLDVDNEAKSVPTYVVNHSPAGRLGNQLQRLVNKLMYAIGKGYDTADVSQVQRGQKLSSILNLPDLITLSDAAKPPDQVPEGCSGHWRDSCNVSISYRFKISQQLLTPYLTCPPNDGFAHGLSIHLRNVETWTEAYRQPPCAMYEDLIENNTFNSVKLIMGGKPPRPKNYQPGPETITQDDDFPCRSRIVDACGRRSPPCSVEVYDSRSLADDACDVVNARNLVLSRGTFGDNLLLLGPRRTSVFAMVPCSGCRSDPFQYLQTQSKYHMEMCQEFGNAFVGYEAPAKYVNYPFRKGDTRNEKAWKSKLSQLMMEFGVEWVAC